MHSPFSDFPLWPTRGYFETSNKILQPRTLAMSNEEAARIVGESRTELRRRLNDARSCLAPHLRPLFAKATFDFPAKRLVSEDGKIALQWRLRSFPDAPGSYDNQQTRVGSVCVIRIA